MKKGLSYASFFFCANAINDSSVAVRTADLLFRLKWEQTDTYNNTAGVAAIDIFRHSKKHLTVYDRPAVMGNGQKRTDPKHGSSC